MFERIIKGEKEPGKNPPYTFNPPEHQSGYNRKKMVPKGGTRRWGGMQEKPH